MRIIYAAAMTLSVVAASTLDYNIEVQNLPELRQNYTFWAEVGDLVSLTAVVMAHQVINERVNYEQNTLIFPPSSHSFSATEQSCLNQAMDKTAHACSLSIATSILSNAGDTIPTGDVNDDEYDTWLDRVISLRLIGAFRPILPDANSGSSSAYTIKYDIPTTWPAMLMGVTAAEETKCVDEAFDISMDAIASCNVLKTMLTVTDAVNSTTQNFGVQLSRGTSSSNTWEIVGIVIGSVVGAALVVTAVYCACRRKRKPALRGGKSEREPRSELDMRPFRRQERERIRTGALRV